MTTSGRQVLERFDLLAHPILDDAMVRHPPRCYVGAFPPARETPIAKRWKWKSPAGRGSSQLPRHLMRRHRFRRLSSRFVDAYGARYLIASYTLNIGMYIATTMKPTMPPTSTIMIGSRIDVSALMAAATSSS